MIYEDFLSQFTDYKPITLYWQRFSIAESFGREEIMTVYNEIFEEAKDDCKLLTELVMVLNHKSWQHCEDIGKSTLCKLYTSLYEKANQYAHDNLKNEDLAYFYKVTD